jgi:squalene synthase HpnC
MAVPHLLPKQYFEAAPTMSANAIESEAYTKWLSHAHYENFHVVSFLLPKHLHQDFYNVYAFCRWSDDLGDEFGGATTSVPLLTDWRRQLNEMYAGEASHPVFVALQQTIARHDLPLQPFDDLLSAFLHDQTVTRYANWSEVFAYCQNSANPVGRLVLMLCGYRDEQRFAWSDQTCTALQLANFWQDVSVDLQKDRVYIPQSVMDRYGYRTEELFAGVEDDRFVGVMREVCAEARRKFLDGLPLISTVNRQLAIDLDLFSRGGLKILDKIEDQGYRVLRQRPKISKWERALLMVKTLARIGMRKAA